MPTMSPEELQEAFNKTKANLFFNKKSAGFLGALLCRLKFEWTTEIDTAAISHDTLYWNPDFFESINQDLRVTVLAHELYHNALLHGVRLHNRCPDKWNQAGDHVINLHLEEHGFYMQDFPFLMDPQYRSMTTEQVYDALMKADGQGGGKGKKKGSSGSESPSGGLGKDIMPVDPKDAQKAVTNVVSAQAAASSMKQAGSMPGEIQMVIDEFLNPKLPWQTLLHNYFNAMHDPERSFARPNRRYTDIIMPGTAPRSGLEHLIYYQDISGSISDEEILRFNSELKFVQEQLRPERLTAVTFDTTIHDIYEFEIDEPFEKITVTGRGGTDLREVWEHANEHKPTAMVVFTDLYVDIPAQKPVSPLLWIAINVPEQTVPYGTLIHIDD